LFYGSVFVDLFPAYVALPPPRMVLFGALAQVLLVPPSASKQLLMSPCCTIIEQNGDGLLEDSHMPVRWPLHIDGAVRQSCIHRAASLQESDDMLKEYDMKRDSVEINRDAPQWSHHAVWNRKYMEPKPGYTLEQLWADSEPAIFFSVQRRMASARSFNMFPSMLQMRLIN